MAMSNNIPVRSFLSVIRKRLLQTSAAAAATCPPPPTSFTVQFLVNSCGFPQNSALSVSHKLQLHDKNIGKMQSVIRCLRSHGFSETHIVKLIEKQPQVLNCKVENKLKPKFEFLIANGFGGKLLPALVLSNTQILKEALDSQIKPSVEFLKAFLAGNDKVIAAVKRCSWLLTFDWKGTVQPNIDLLIKEGVPVDNVAKLIMWQPRAIQQKHDKMVDAVNFLKDLGLQPDATAFINALRVRLQMSESTWKNKIEVMKILGWGEEEILMAFKQLPSLLAVSEEKIKGGVDFLVNTLKLTLQDIIDNPIFIMYSIDKRLRPRYNVLKVLESNKLIEVSKKMKHLMKITEKDFLWKYVCKYEDAVPGLLEMYVGISKTKIRGS